MKVGMVNEIDMSKVLNFRKKCKTHFGHAPSITAIIAKAIQMAVEKHPQVNRAYLGFPLIKKVKQFNGVHISIAVERNLDGDENPVYAHTLYDVKERTVFELDRELRDLNQLPAEKDKRYCQYFWLLKNLPACLSAFMVGLCQYHDKWWYQMRGGAFLISSPGKYGVDTIMGGWNWPVSFSFGLLKNRAIVVDGEVVSRPTIHLTMSFNRGLVSGAPAARFMSEVSSLLENAAFDGVQSDDFTFCLNDMMEEAVA